MSPTALETPSQLQHTVPAPASMHVAGYALARPLGATRLGPRWLAHLEPTHEAAVACRVGGTDVEWDRRTAREIVGSIGRLEHPHIVRVLSTSVDGEGNAWIFTNYTGTVDGLTTLSGLVALKGGVLARREVFHAVRQLLDASAFAHKCDEAHGELSIDEVLVSRRGSVQVEHYGVARQLQQRTQTLAEARAAELRSVATIACELISGLPGLEGRAALRKASRHWSRWTESVLEKRAGFCTPQEALAALPAV